MSHKPISFHNVGLSFPQKVCFEGLTTHIHPGDRIAIIGQNGSGKTTLFKMVQGLVEPTEGHIECPPSTSFGYVPQVLEAFGKISGGQRFQKALSHALSLQPDVLLLDEPTNHLDAKNRHSLIRLLRNYKGTLILISHDVELLRHSGVVHLWHIQDGKVRLFSGAYDDYLQDLSIKRRAIEQEISRLDHQKKQAHVSLMKEQVRAKQSRLQGEKHIEQRKWPTIVSDEKARRAVETSGRKKKAISHKKQELIEELSELRPPEILTPKFSLEAFERGARTLLSIQEGSVGYVDVLLRGIHFSLQSRERWAIKGDNGSGKTTLVKAILGDPEVVRGGHWLTPKREEIGYLDQHYQTLDPAKTVLETIEDLAPAWSHRELREHLNDFLFRKTEEVEALVETLSGGEKARLSLAQIAAKPPILLILDEMTNNLDLETRDHVIQVLKKYPGALLVVSHDEGFLNEIMIKDYYTLRGMEGK